MNILISRYIMIDYIVQAFGKINVPLIGFDGASFIPFTGNTQRWTGSFDDVGIFILIPKLINWCNLSVQQGIDVFFYGIKYMAFVIGFFYLLLMYRSLSARVATTMGMFFLLFVTKVAAVDVYIAYFAMVIGIIPPFLYYLERSEAFNKLLGVLLLSGFTLSSFHYIRSHSGLAVWVFIMMAIFLSTRLLMKQKAILLGALLCSSLVPWYYFNNQMRKYDEYARTHFSDLACFPTKHPFWHTVYAGLGLLRWKNDDNIEFDDGCVFRMVEKKDPSISLFQMDEYEKIVKDEVIHLIKTKPFFIAATLFAKIGILLFYLLFFANIGLLAAYYCPKSFTLELSFIMAILTSIVFPFIALPFSNYTLSFITLCILYGIISLSHYLEMNQAFLINYSKRAFKKRVRNLQFLNS